MKTAIYFENGYAQIVLTPENDFEKSALSTVAASPGLQVKKGEFYHCVGGWVREGPDMDSTILICKKSA